MRERNKFGIAIAAMIKIIAITIKSSMSEKPFCLLKRGPPLILEGAGQNRFEVNGVYRIPRFCRGFLLVTIPLPTDSRQQVLDQEGASVLPSDLFDNRSNPLETLSL